MAITIEKGFAHQSMRKTGRVVSRRRARSAHHIEIRWNSVMELSKQLLCVRVFFRSILFISNKPTSNAQERATGLLRLKIKGLAHQRCAANAEDGFALCELGPHRAKPFISMTY